MKIERSKNTVRGLFSGSINKIISIILPFVIQTVTIKVFGMEYVGVNGLFTSILTVLNLTELGIGSAIIYSMYKPIANDDVKTICALLNLYKKIYRTIGIVILFIGVIITPFITFFISDSYPNELNIRAVFLLYLFNTVISYWLYSYKSSLLLAYQRTDIISSIGTIISITLSIFQVAFILITRNFYVFLILSIAFTIIRNLLISLCADRMFPEIRSEGKVSTELKDDIKVKVKGLLIGNICGVTRNAFDSMFISKFLGLTQVAIYTNYFYVLTSVSGLVNVILTSISAGVGNSLASESKEKNYNDMMRMNRIYMIVIGWTSICMLCLYQPFMEIWVGKNNSFPNYVMILFPIYNYILGMGNILGIYSSGAGMFWENRYREIAEAIANIVLNYVLVRLLGVFGILLATILTICFIGFCGSTIVNFKYVFNNIGRGKFVFSQMKCLLITSVVGLLCYYLCGATSLSNVWITLFIRLGICCIVAPLCYYMVLHRTEEYKDSVNWLVTRIAH